jgi:hypothetical protein
LEKHYRDMQDFEFTVERGTLFMLANPHGKRTGIAAVQVAVDMVKEKLISKEEALIRIEPDQLAQLLAPVFDGKEKTAGGQRRPIVGQRDRRRSWRRHGPRRVHVRTGRGNVQTRDPWSWSDPKPIPTTSKAWLWRKAF